MSEWRAAHLALTLVLSALVVAAFLFGATDGCRAREEHVKQNQTNSAQPAQEIDMAEKLARTVGPTIGAEIHPDDATIGIAAFKHSSRHLEAFKAGTSTLAYAVELCRESVAEAKRQRLAAEVKP